MNRIYYFFTFCILVFFAKINFSYSQDNVQQGNVAAPDSTMRHSFESSLQELLDEEVDYENLWSNARVMTASRSVERIGTAPATIYVVTEEQIRQRGYTSLEDVLGDIPEIEIQQKANTYTNSYYSIRGIGGNERFVILQDGIRISSITGVLHPVQHNFAIYHAKQIEVILGPASALYGADAFSGIINIITKNGAEIKGAEINSSFGRFNTADNSFVAGAAIKDISVMIYGKQYYSAEPNFPEFYKEDFDWYINRYQTNGEVLASQFVPDVTRTVEIEPFAMPTQAYNVGAKIGVGENFTVGFTHHQQTHSTSVANRPEYTLFKKDIKYGTNLTNIYTSFQRTIDKFYFRTIASFNHFTVDEDSNFENVYSSYQKGYKYASESTFQFDQQFQYYFTEKTNLTFGVLYQNAKALPQTGDLPNPYNGNIPEFSSQQYYIGTNVLDSSGNDLTIFQNFYWTEYQNYGVYAQFKTSFADRLYMTLGTRYDYNTRYEGAFNPRVGLVFSPDAKFNIKLLYGEAFLAPSNQKTFQHFGDFIPVTNDNNQVTGFALPFYHLPNPQLRPERNRTFEVNASYAPVTNLRFGADVYHNTLTDLIVDVIQSGQTFKGIDVGAAEVSVNQGSATTYGGTFQAIYHQKFGDWKVHTNLAYSYSDGKLNGGQLPLSAMHTLRLMGEFSYKNFDFTPSVLYRSTSYHTTFKDDAGNPLGNDPFWIASLYAGYNIKEKFTVFVRIKNLLDARYYNASLPNVTSFVGVPQDPLRWNLGFNWKF
ncbi:TonB-dependent receptor plug domain-containing protein [Bernardetia sp. OM2101]|uniref:TonB-dependent receptor plug domain-containing protein n=1 Tax=Bernardetia sp. OM2101 TaxID=3344876 RepID=UPI0035D00EA6